MNSDIATESMRETMLDLRSKLSPKLDKTLPAILIGSIITTALHNHPTSLQIDLGVVIRDFKKLINLKTKYCQPQKKLICQAYQMQRRIDPSGCRQFRCRHIASKWQTGHSFLDNTLHTKRARWHVSWPAGHHQAHQEIWNVQVSRVWLASFNGRKILNHPRRQPEHLYFHEGACSESLGKRKSWRNRHSLSWKHYHDRSMPRFQWVQHS